MNRKVACAWRMQLSWLALSVLSAGCTASQPATGGIEATLSLDAGAVVQQIDTVTVTISCDGIDPITGLPWPSETFDVNVSSSEGNNPLDPKDSLGVFKKEGLPEGSCTVTLSATSTNGALQCGGQMTDIPVVAGPDNTFVTIVVNCITDARYGGIGVDGEFNQCAEYAQIIVSPTTQSAVNDVDVDIWCYDPDGDDALATVMFVTAASVSANPTNPAAWLHCGTNPGTAFPPTPLPCPHMDPPTVPGNQSTDTIVTCNLSNEACLVIVAVSDDGFASGGTDPVGCTGQDDNANAVVPVYCVGIAVCGDSVVELPEECDPPGDPNGSNEFCNASCKFYDPCDNPLAPPASCPDVTDPECQSLSCSESGGAISCGIDNAPNGTACSIGNCYNGNCQACAVDADCDDNNDCTVDACVAGACDYTTQPVGSACTDFGSGQAGTCSAAGLCEPTLRILVTNDDGYAADGIDAVVTALVANPNNQVIVSAPLTNQSGTSDDTNCSTLAATSVTTSSGYPATAVDGCPADAVNHAMANLYTPSNLPHLLISGLNRGQNVSEGLATDVSGTVGAAKTAARNHGIPALASSQAASQGILGGASTNYDYPSGVAEVLSWLSANRSVLVAGGIVPTDVINLNIPSCDAGAIRGIEIDIPMAPDSVGALDGQDCTSTLTNPAHDTEALNNGFITYSSVPLCNVDADCPGGGTCNAGGYCDPAPITCPLFDTTEMVYNRPTWSPSGGSCISGASDVRIYGSTGWNTQASCFLRSNPALGGANDIYCYRQLRQTDGTPWNVSGWGTPPGVGQITITNDEFTACSTLISDEITAVGLTCP